MTESKNFLDRPRPAAFLAALIIFSAISFSIETLPDLNSDIRYALQVFEWTTVTIFTAEYVYRIYAAKDKLKFIFSIYGLIDLLAIAPFFLSLAVDLRALRVVRLIRLLRLLKLARYVKALNRLASAFRKAKDELVVSIAILTIVMYLAAFGIYHFEHSAQPDKFSSIFDALWWSVATVTTVGYGDIYPITLGGRLFTFLVLIASLGLVAVPTGIFATALFSIRNTDNEKIGS